uniref:hypothetical protein n=1 Tax=Variovorax sp. BK018 TaxID=3450241 RepID=UPI0040391DF7
MSHPYRYLARLVQHRLPMFVARPSRLRRVQRLVAAGHVEARFYPPDANAVRAQFCEVVRVTTIGREALEALAQRHASQGDEAPHIQPYR